MRAITVTDDHRMTLVEVDEPTAAADEVLVDVVAAGVNRADLAQVAGHYPPPAGASEVPGLEVSGHRRDTGEAVVALLAGGGYADVVAVPTAQLLPVPRGVDLIDAAGVIEVAATVVSNLVLEGGLRIGTADDGDEEAQTVLIHGATGGVGTFATQFAAAAGARVLAVAGSAEGVERLRGLGAAAAWDRHAVDLVRAVGDEGGADIVLDVLGGDALDDNVRMLREFGRVVVIGTMRGSSGSLDLGALMAKRARIIGTTVRSRSIADKGRILEAVQRLAWPLLESGRIAVPIHARVPLADAARGHAILRDGGHYGKVVLEVAPPR